MYRHKHYYLTAQTMVGQILIFLLAPTIFCLLKAAGYRIRDIDGIRSQCRNHFRRHPGPWLICSNHLTMIDSLIVTYSMLSLSQVVFRFARVPWNVPEKDNFHRNIVSRFLCYALKCIPVNRLGQRDGIRATLNRCIRVLKNKQNVMIFPEGTRSRSGRICMDDFPYGTGRIFCHVPDCKVLCIYIRGDHQRAYSVVPRYREIFTVDVRVVQPVTGLKGLRAHRDVAGQIIGQLAGMEDRYFAMHR